MQMTISKIQRACMFSGSALFGSLCVVGVLLQEFQSTSETRVESRQWPFYISGGIALVCYLSLPMVVGAWLGGVLSAVWRSPPGTRWFWMLSCGSMGGILGTVGAMYWLLAQGPSLGPIRGPMVMVIYGGISMLGTLIGFLIGQRIGRRLEHAAMMKATAEQGVNDHGISPPRTR